VIRRTSIFVLASVMSFLATQPLPARTTSSSQGYAIHWQKEARAQKAAEITILNLRATLPKASPEFRGEAANLLPSISYSSRNPRAPPIVSSAT
jgi:hypothetical protein